MAGMFVGRTSGGCLVPASDTFPGKIQVVVDRGRQQTSTSDLRSEMGAPLIMLVSACTRKTELDREHAGETWRLCLELRRL